MKNNGNKNLSLKNVKLQTIGAKNGQRVNNNGANNHISIVSFLFHNFFRPNQRFTSFQFNKNITQ